MQSQATEQRPAQAATARAGRSLTPASMNSRCQSSSISNAQIRLSSSSAAGGVAIEQAGDHVRGSK